MVESDNLESSLSFPVIDWADSLQGEDEADHDRQGIVRGVLQIELWHHEKVVTLFAPWWNEIAGSLTAAAVALENYAALSGRRPADVLPIRSQTDVLPPEALGHSADDLEAASAYEDARRKCETAVEACAEVQLKQAAPIADFIMGTFSIPLPPWTAIALLRLFVTEFWARLTDTDFTLMMVPPDPRTETDFSATLHVPRGSTAEESRAAVVKFAAEALIAMGWSDTKPPRAPGSRRKARPKHEGEALERDALLFCRAILYDEGPTEIARKAGISRQRVQHAIKRVFDLLKVYVLPSETEAPAAQEPPSTLASGVQNSARKKKRRTLRKKRPGKSRR